MSGLTWFPKTSDEVENALRHFEGYAKLQGMLLPIAMGLPTLRGLVVDPSANPTIEEVVAQASLLHPSSYLVRHDRAPEVGSYPQGGYVISASELSEELAWYKAAGRLLILLEPAHPLENGYSGAATVTADGIVSVEIVGPGFDASDLNRGFITPHESASFFVHDEGRPRRISKSSTDAEAYSLSKQLRVRKIALKYLRRSRHPNVGEISYEDAARELGASPWVQRPEIASLLSADAYKSAPGSFVSTIARYADTIRTHVFHSSQEQTVAFSCSQIESGRRVVVWDVVFPQRKYKIV